MKHSRRQFVKGGAATLACSSLLLQASRAFAAVPDVRLGLQLYSLRKFLPTDFENQLKQVGGLGYKDVESAGYYGKSVTEVKKAVSDAGLKLVSAHHPSGDLNSKPDEIIAFDKELGVEYVICSSPGVKDPARAKSMTRDSFTLDDWKWNADQFNGFAEKVSAAGMKFGYHNHTMEFHKVDGVVPFMELLRLTDPAKVSIEMDCGWVTVGGGNPIEILEKHGDRIIMLHVKDFTKATIGSAEPTPTELGMGSIDYAPIFSAAAKTGHIRHIFVEQEAFDVPPMQSLKMDADYMKKLGIS